MPNLIYSDTYEVQEKIAQGGMGIVYKALDRKLNRVVALKVVHPHLTSDPSSLQLFLREARSLARLQHENIVSIFSVEQDRGTQFIVMEYFQGTNLLNRIQSGVNFPLHEAITITYKMAKALAYAHEHGIIHRDVKPANVLLGSNNRVKLTDFGIAAALNEVPLTSPGQLIGTLRYMSPEQARDTTLDGRSDLYSLGLMFYEMLTGTHPRRNLSNTAILGMLTTEEKHPPLVFPSSIPADVQTVVKHLMRYRPVDRIEDAHQLLRRLESLDAFGDIAPSSPSSIPTALTIDETICEWREPNHSSSIASDPTGETAVGPSQSDNEDADFGIVKIFYGSSRERSGSLDPSNFYTGNRGLNELGSCEVSIPRDHRMGNLEAPALLRFELRQNPSKHVVLIKIDVLEEARFIAEIMERADKSDKKQAFIFVHGYNVTFEDAARRTAQLAYDLGFEGAPIAYSWPSQGKVGSYMIDETNAEWTVPHFQSFLEKVVSAIGPGTIHVIAHSMGNRVVSNALRLIRLSSLTSNVPILKHLVLTAPDIDTAVFLSLSEHIKPTAHRTTLYASSRDEALILSKRVHGYPRAGDTQPLVCLADGLDTIDASTVETSFLGHSYFSDNKSVLSDIFNLIKHSLAPDQRFGLLRQTQGGKPFWKFAP